MAVGNMTSIDDPMAEQEGEELVLAMAVGEVSEEDLEQALEDAKRELEKQEQERRDILETLALAVSKKYMERKSRRGSKEHEWITAAQLKLGSLSNKNKTPFSPDRPFESTATANRRPDKNIVRTRCEIAVAEMIAGQFGGGEKNWDTLPADTSASAQIPDLAERCEKMEAEMANQLEEACYQHESMKALCQLVDLGTGVLKGPCNYSKMTKTYERLDDGVNPPVWVPSMKPEQAPGITYANIWMLYPDDTVPMFNDSPDMIEVHPKSVIELGALKKNPGFIPEAIDQVLEIGVVGGSQEQYSGFTTVTDTNTVMFKDKFTVLEYHGPITKTQLEKLEIDAGYDVPGDVYFGEVWVVHDKVIRIELSNLEGSTKPPYSADVWVTDPSSPFGFGAAILLRDPQRIVTETLHMILDNASASSAPQIVINQEMIEPANGEYEMAPAKVWYFNEISGDVSKAFQQFSIGNVTANLFPIMELGQSGAEEESGIALMSAGLQSSQVGTDNATSLAILNDSSTTLLDQKLANWDKNVVYSRMQALYDWNMQYNPDDSIKCPMKVRIRAATDYRNKQMYIRDMEKISVEAAQNPALAERINIDELTRARLSMMTIPTRAIIKSDEQLAAEREQQAQNPPPPNPDEIKAQAELARIDLEKQRLELEKLKLQFELTAAQQREQWENEERRGNTFARIAEAEAQVVKSQNEKEIRLLELAAKADNEAERNRLTAGMQMKNDETKKFLGGLAHTAKVRDQLLTQEELQIKRNTGSGI